MTEWCYLYIYKISRAVNKITPKAADPIYSIGITHKSVNTRLHRINADTDRNTRANLVNAILLPFFYKSIEAQFLRRSCLQKAQQQLNADLGPFQFRSGHGIEVAFSTSSKRVADICRSAYEDSIFVNQMPPCHDIETAELGVTPDILARKLGFTAEHDDEGGDFDPIDLNAENVLAARKVRPAQRIFAAKTMDRYGRRCMVCEVNIGLMLEAAHVVAKEDRGKDSSLNGLVLCANHHLAFDKSAFIINPERYTLLSRIDGSSLKDLAITRSRLESQSGKLPARSAIRYRWESWNEINN